MISDALINDGTARHSERAIRMFSNALKCSMFDVRCLDDRSSGCTFDERRMPVDAIARVVPKLRHRNANGSGVYIRPCLPYALADDVPAGTVDRMLDDDQRIAAVIETSPGSFQVWIPLAGPLQSIDPAVCAAACERLVELYDTDPGVAHQDSFGRAPGFFNRKAVYEIAGKWPLVIMNNRLSYFRGYDRILLGEARRSIADQPQLLDQRSAGAVPYINDHDFDTLDELGPIEVLQDGHHVVTFSTISTASLFEKWLAGMAASGYALPQRPDHSGTDRSQRDLDILRSMHTAGVPRATAQTALEAGSDKAQERRRPTYVQHLLCAVWGGP